MQKNKFYTILVLSISLYTGFCIYDYHQAYYGDSLYITNVLPFGLNIEKMWDNKEKCYRYAFICPEYFMDNKFDLFIRIDNYHPEQSLFVKTILAYAYKKDEIIVHWMGCDSCDYYVRMNSSKWRTLSPSQIISKEKIIEDNYRWINLYDKKSHTDYQQFNQHPCVKTILAYGYKKNETIIHWMICDSCDYYVKKNFSEWKSMSPPQPVSKEQIDIDSYNWVTLYDKK